MFPGKLSEQVEQDLVICRALVTIFSDKLLASSLAFRGGTALHKLYLQPQSRYSEDIDLVQIRPEPIKETVQLLQKMPGVFRGFHSGTKKGWHPIKISI